jgi:hypothetical protein
MSAFVESIAPAALLSPAVDDAAAQEALMQFLSGLAERSECFASEFIVVDGVPDCPTDSKGGNDDGSAIKRPQPALTSA